MSGNDPNDLGGLNYEKVNYFKYLGSTLNTKNDWSKEIIVWLNKGGNAFYTLMKFLRSKTIPK